MKNLVDKCSCSHKWSLEIFGLCIGLGLAICGFFISKTIYNSRIAINTATVKGLAERRVIADTARWQISFSTDAYGRGQILVIKQKLEDAQNKIVQILTEHGCNQQEITVGLIQYSEQDHYDNEGFIGYSQVVLSSISLLTNKVHNISKARAAVNNITINSFIMNKIKVHNEPVFFLFTKLNDIKPQMLKEATKDALIAANEFAKNAGVQVGNIKHASQGNFQVVDIGKEYDSLLTMEKDVRVITEISFYLK